MTITPNEYHNIPDLDDPLKIFSLKDRIGIIAGGTGKMGQQFASVLSQAGATVVLADLSEEKCSTVAASLQPKSGGKVVGICCDVSRQESVEKTFSNIVSDYGRLDFLINNVMAKPEGYYSPFEEYSKVTWDKVMEVNLSGTFLCCREAVKIMKRQKLGGSIVITSSTYGVSGPDQRIYRDCSPGKNIYGGNFKLNAPASYSASKAGLIGLARYLATYVGSKGIRVNVLTPGGVFDGQEASFHTAYTDKVPLGRMAVWSDYNGAILFLVSDASRYMTGSNLVVDGGWTAW
ncbi:MAG: SDR family oxidoreductase [Candidatus Latescibacteria bacterium]|nr:SDR family oxidoreductase [Candidatus Latescibacterota bacterium]